MRHNGDRSPDEIQAEIERTRSDLNQTLSAIERRLTPGQLVDQGIDYLRHSGAREYVMNLGASAKQDPLPLALVGIGLGWLMLSRREPTGQGVVTRPGPSADKLAEGARDAAGSVRGAASSVRGAVSSAVSSVGEKVSSVRDSAAHTSQRISETTRAVRDRAHEVGAAAREGADRVRSGFDRLAHEQPLALGAIGVAVGAVLAASAPRTRQEDSLVGDASDRLKDKARQAGEEELDRATTVLGQGSGRSSDGDTRAEEQTGRPAPVIVTASPSGLG